MSILKDQMGLNINEKNEVEIDISDIVSSVTNISTLNVTIPHPFDLGLLDRTIPNLNLSAIKNLNITLPNGSVFGNVVNLGDLLDGNVTITLKNVLERFNES
jgi:hypothetical protein